MIQLTEWYLDKAWMGDIFARGYVEGHHRLEDGAWIHTSKIESIEAVEGDRFIMHTYSGSVYELAIAEIESRGGRGSCGFLSELGISEAVCARVMEVAEQKLARMQALAEQVLSEQELYLYVRENNALMAYWKDATGTVREIVTGYHSGMFQDSVLVTDFKLGEVDFRYFPKWWNVIEPYHWSDGLEAIWIHNVAKESIEFAGTTERIVCPGKQSVRIPKSAYTEEGLMSPDVVNGKCMLRDMMKETGDAE